MELPISSQNLPAPALILSTPEVASRPTDRSFRKGFSNRRRLHQEPSRRPLLLDLWDLTKPEISFLVTISALAGFLLGAQEDISGWLLYYALLGTVLTAAGGGVLNHYLERHHDARMHRTANRPLPSGRVDPRIALTLGTGLTVMGVVALFLKVNLLTTVLAALTVFLYLFVYTPLKRITKYNTLIGTIPGALPALGGWAATTGNLAIEGWAIFFILAFWQMPHFLALAWMYRKDYARAGYAMLTVVEPDGRSTSRQTLAFTVLLAIASILPAVAGLAGMVYLVGALFLSVWFLFPTYAFYRSRSTRDARRVLIGSILYIPLLLVLIFVDRLV